MAAGAAIGLGVMGEPVVSGVIGDANA